LIEIVIGSVIGAIVSLIIAELYHRRASKETAKEMDRLASLNSEISETLDNATSLIESSSESTETIKKHAIAGTPDDPEYPYK